MRKKAIFITIILLILVVMNKVYATEERISQEVIEESSNIESTEVNRETAVILLSEEVTVVETWDISATETDSVIGTLYSNGTLVISGTGNMKDYSISTQNDWYNYREDILKVIVKTGVNNIGHNAFGYCYQNIEDVEIEEGLTEIGVNSFYQCIKLKKINFPNSLEMIPYLAFADCESLESITLPGSLKKVGQKSFMGCGGLKEVYIKEGLEEILKDTFSDCSNLNKVTLPNSLISIDEYVFYNCDIEEITIPANVTNISKSAFNGCNNLTNINVYPNSYAEEYVKENYNNKLNVIDIMETWDISATEEDSVEATLYNNGTLIISGNGNMKDYDYEAVDLAPWYDYREEIKDVDIKRGIKNIGNFTFGFCSNITNINISEGVINIGEYALYRVGVEEVRIPSTVETIQNYALSSIELKNIIVDKNNSKFVSEDGILLNKDKTKILSYPPKKDLKNYIIPNDILIIGRGAFAGCKNLKEIIIPEGVTAIEGGAFSECDALESIKIPNSVLTIGDYAFMYCYNLVSIEIGEGLTKFGYRTFEGCGDLEYIKVYCNTYAEEYVTRNYSDKLSVIHTFEDAITEPTCTQQGYTTHTCTRCSDSYVDAYTEAKGHSYGEWTVTKESTYIEKGEKQRECSVCQNIEKEEIQVINYNKIVETWDISATEDDNVTAILYNDGTLIITGRGNMEDYDFNAGKHTPWYDYRKAIEKVEIKNGIKNIGGFAFATCENIIDISIPEGIVDIGTYALNATEIEEITLPSTVETIGEYALHTKNLGTKGLKNIFVDANNKKFVSEDGILFNIDKTEILLYPPQKEAENYIVPNTVVIIGAGAFGRCENLTSIDLGDSIEKIKASAFLKCSNLVNIEIPETVTSIDTFAFADCMSLTSIKIPENVTSIGVNVFEWSYNLTNIDVYCNSYPEEYVTQNYNDKLSIVHTYEDIITEPTCTERGYTTHTCTRCSDSYVDLYTEPKGHSYGEWNITEEATCTEAGSKEKICSVCKDRQTEQIAALGHSYSTEWTEDLAPTCTEVGSKSHHCTRENCDSKTDETLVEALGHNYVIKETTDAVCEQGGKITYECSRCEDTYDEDVPAKGHSYGEWNITEEATCTEAGSRQKVCCVCQGKERETIDALGHNYGEWTVDKEATCTEVGEKSKYCTICNSSRTEITTIAPLGHNFGAWVIDKEPTYEEEGHKYRVCTNCNTEKEEQVIPVLTKEELQVSTTYTVKEKDNVKFAMSTVNTNVSQILSNITANKEIKVVDKSGKELGANDLVGTGAKVVTKEDNKEIYTVVLQGDVNCDGKITFNDIIRTNAIRINQDENKISKAELFAADIDDSQKIEFRDIIKINAIRINNLISQ